MALRCYMLAIVAVVFSGCLQTVHSVGELPRDKLTCDTPQCCQTPECISTAAAMMEKMNSSADPCEDFNEFACGRFLKTYVLPPGIIDMQAFSDLHYKGDSILHDLLINTTDPSRPRYVKNMQRLFNTCMNLTQIDVVGLTPFLNDRIFVDDWPTLNPRWSDAGFDVDEVIARYSRVNVYPIFDVYVSKNKTDATKLFIELAQPSLGLHQAYFLQARNHSDILAYETYLAETAIALNASREVAERDARGVVDLEIDLARILEQQRDDTKPIKPIYRVKLNQFSKVYPRPDFERAIRATFGVANITLPDDEIVINTYTRYIKDIESVLECHPKRTIQNLFGFKYALKRVERLTQQMRNITIAYHKALGGTGKQDPRLNFCINTIRSRFKDGVSKMFVNRMFSQTAKIKVNEMINELNEVFEQIIDEATWMSNSTKIQALRKLTYMKRKIGYPDTEFDEPDIERIYEKYNMSADNFYHNQKLVTDLGYLNYLASLKKHIDHNTWLQSPHDINAHATRERNEIVLLAGVMQPPIYWERAEDYMNYGAIGFTIGHEITHLFDDIGKQYDENGTLCNWWTAEDNEKFFNRSKCIEDQYSNFYVDDINMTMNGVKSRSENEADIGGIKASYRAYKKHILNRTTDMWLPNVNLTHHQLFFLSMAQDIAVNTSIFQLYVDFLARLRSVVCQCFLSGRLTYPLFCQVATPQRKLHYVKSTMHSLGKYRIIGTMQNSEDFARAYNCPLGSYMNPEKKCGVW